MEAGSGPPRDAFRVPGREARAEVRARGSRFLALAAAARDEVGARGLRDEERRRFHDATHHVFGYLSASGDERWDDDGEPAGTGGRPVVASIASSGLRDVVVVVTRWFGGTKLGTGGLGRAYGAASAAALAEVPPVVVRPGLLVRVRYGWGDTGLVSASLDAFGASGRDERHGPEGVETVAAIAAADAAALSRRLRERTGGRVTMERLPGEVRVPWTS